MNLKRSLYNTMVNRVPGIKEKYRKKRSRVKGIGRIGIWFYLLGLNLSYYIFRNKSLAYTEKFALYEKKRLYDKGVNLLYQRGKTRQYWQTNWRSMM